MPCEPAALMRRDRERCVLRCVLLACTLAALWLLSSFLQGRRDGLTVADEPLRRVWSLPRSGTALPASRGTCPAAQQHSEYGGDVVRWGTDNMQASAGACCASCEATAGCNTWVFCDAANGCSGGGRPHGECWLKRCAVPARPLVSGAGPGVGWTSGALFNSAEAAGAAQIDAVEQRELDALRFAPGNARVFLDVSIDDGAPKRMEFMLFANTSPRWAENLLGLCRGDRGVAPAGAEGAGKTRSLVGASFYRILDQFIDQTGAGTDSVFGGAFPDDEGGLRLKHNRRGLLSAANMGRDTSTSHFSILMAPAPHLDGSYAIFGELVAGWEVAVAINALASPSGTPTGRAVIVAAGQLE